MAVNTLVTGLIVFKILMVFLEVKAAVTRSPAVSSVERALGSTRGTKLRHIIFIIIESGMALFAIQLVRILLLAVQSYNPLQLVLGIHQMFNVIIRSVYFYFLFFFKIDTIYLTRASYQR